MSQILTFQISATGRLRSCGWDPRAPGESSRAAQHGQLVIEGANWVCPRVPLMSEGYKGPGQQRCPSGGSVSPVVFQKEGPLHAVEPHCFICGSAPGQLLYRTGIPWLMGS